MAAASRIVFARHSGLAVHCAFLADGGRASPTRNRETTQALGSLGVHPSQIHFIGITDGQLIEHLDQALMELETRMRAIALDSIYCLAWEGGHHDHDASHLIAAALARRRGLLDRCFELPVYRAARSGPPFFRVFSPLAAGQPWARRRLSLREGFRFSLLPWKYPSQWSSWRYLLPEAFLKLVVLRRELIRPVEITRLRSRPHQGTLFYEWRFRFPFERFEERARDFIDREF